MSMDPPKVLIEQSMLQAVADTSHPHHHDAALAYRDLVEQYRHEAVLLMAVSDHLRLIDLGPTPTTGERVKWFLHRRPLGVFAAVDPLHVGFQHRRAARRTNAPTPDVALTIVMCSRARIRRVATLDPVFEQFDLKLQPTLSG
jgi:predicted nucleic acid-binding protein